MRSPLRVVFFACLTLLVSAPLRADDDSTLEAKIRIDEDVFDWGTLLHGQDVEHRFRLTNAGEDAVEIDEIKTSCGCTFASENANGKTLATGASIDVTLRIETAKLPPKQLEEGGVIRKSGEVVTKDGRTVATLWMRGFVQRVLIFEPDVARLELIRDDGTPPAEFSVRAIPGVEGKKLRILGIRGEGDIVDAKVRSADDGSYAIDLRSKVAVDAEDPNHADTLLVRAKVDDAEVEIPLPVSVRIRPRIDVSPSKSFWFPRSETSELGKEGAAPPAKELEIRSVGRPEHRFEITGVRVENGRFRAKVETIEKGRRYRLRIEVLPPGEDAGRMLRDKIEIRTDDPLVPVISIPGSALL